MARRRRTVDEVSSILDGYDGIYLDCRLDGHVWRSVGMFRGADAVVIRRTECLRCGTGRLQRWGVHGARIGASYQYPVDYQVREVRVTHESVRVETMRRATVYASEDQMMAAIDEAARPRELQAV